MREASIRSRTKRKLKATTNSNHKLPVAQNLEKQNFKVDAPNRAWVADLTYVSNKEVWLYLDAVMNLFNRKIIDWAASSRMIRQLAIDALQMAVDQQKLLQDLVHHSDRGRQYA